MSSVDPRSGAQFQDVRNQQAYQGGTPVTTNTGVISESINAVVNGRSQELSLGHVFGGDSIVDRVSRALGSGNLRVLSLPNNGITNAGIGRLMQALFSLKHEHSLWSLDLSYNTNDPSVFTSYYEGMLPLMPNLASVNLTQEPATAPEAVTHLSNAFIKKAKEGKLPNLVYVEPATEELKQFCEANKRAALALLDKLTKQDEHPLAEADFREIANRLPAIFMVATRERPIAEPAIAKLLVTAAKKAKWTGIEINLPAHVIATAKEYRSHIVLRDIDDFAPTLAQKVIALRSGRSTEIRVAYTDFGDELVPHLQNAFSSPYLRELYLQSNNIKNREAAGLFRMIATRKHCPYTLDLSNNSFGQELTDDHKVVQSRECVDSFAAMLVKHGSQWGDLAAINLKGTGLALGDPDTYNALMDNLYVSQNIVYVEPAGSEKLSEACEANKKEALELIDGLRDGTLPSVRYHMIPLKLPSIFVVARHERGMTEKEVAEMLIKAEQCAFEDPTIRSFQLPDHIYATSHQDDPTPKPAVANGIPAPLGRIIVGTPPSPQEIDDERIGRLIAKLANPDGITARDAKTIAESTADIVTLALRRGISAEDIATGLAKLAELMSDAAKRVDDSIDRQFSGTPQHEGTISNSDNPLGRVF